MCNDDSNMPRPRRRYPTSIRESHCARTGSGGGALEGWDPSDEQIAELEAVMIGMLSRREYFEQELARASASRLRFPRGSAGDDQRRTSIAVHRFSRTISTYEIPPHCNHSSSRRPRFAWVRRISQRPRTAHARHSRTSPTSPARFPRSVPVGRTHQNRRHQERCGNICSGLGDSELPVRGGRDHRRRRLGSARSRRCVVRARIGVLDAQSCPPVSGRKRANRNPLPAPTRRGHPVSARLVAGEQNRVGIRVEGFCAFRPTGTPSPRPFIDLFNRALTR